MFLLCGARPYVSIVRVYVYMYVCVYMSVYVCVCMCVCVYVCVCVFIGLLHHSEGTCWRYISSSNKLKLKYTLSKLCVNESYAAASGRLELTPLQMHRIYLPTMPHVLTRINIKV